MPKFANHLYEQLFEKINPLLVCLRGHYSPHKSREKNLETALKQTLFLVETDKGKQYAVAEDFDHFIIPSGKCSCCGKLTPLLREELFH